MITIHSKTNCPFCVKAKQFMKDHDLDFTEIIYDPTLEIYEKNKNNLVARTNFKTFPQIFIGETFLGGFSDLELAFATLKLHDLLAEVGITLEPDF